MRHEISCACYTNYPTPENNNKTPKYKTHAFRFYICPLVIAWIECEEEEGESEEEEREAQQQQRFASTALAAVIARVIWRQLTGCTEIRCGVCARGNECDITVCLSCYDISIIVRSNEWNFISERLWVNHIHTRSQRHLRSPTNVDSSEERVLSHVETKRQ